jgi:hypothetical protein
MKAANAQIGECLGVQPPATETEILRIVEGRLAPAVIKRLISLGLESGEIDAAIIPQRTLQHRRARREKLTVEESDRVLRAYSGLVACRIRLREPGTGACLVAEASWPTVRSRRAFAAQDGYWKPSRRGATHPD